MDGAPPSEDFESLAIPDRLTHKVWKARLSAYDSIISSASKTIDEDDQFFNEPFLSGSSMREWVRDANAVAQDKGVEAACKVVEMGGKSLNRTRPEVVPSVVEKCLGAARASTKQKGIELCLLYAEMEEDMGEGVIGDVIPGLDMKQPKIVAACVTVLKELVYSLGPKAISLKPILQTLPKIFSHADKTVRSEGSLLCLSLHSYLGPALTPHLTDLKPVQVKELQESFEKSDRGEMEGYGMGKLKPTRFTWSVKREMKVKEAEGTLSGGEANGVEEDGVEAEEEQEAEDLTIDPFELATAIPVVTALPPDFYTHLSSSKWKDRKELALEPLLTLLSSSIKYDTSSNYTELVTALSGRMTDANVLCVMLAANCIEKLAKGLREEFKGYKGVVTSPLLGRTKEKKQNVLDALGNALDAVYQSASIGDFTEDVTTFTKDKNPSIKLQTLLFYVRCLRSTPSPPPKSDLPPLLEAFKKTLEDSDGAVRAASAEALGTMMKVIGERAFLGLVGEVDPLRMEKVKEGFEKAETKCKDGRSAGAKPPPAAGATKSAAPSAASKSKPRGAPPSSNVAKTKPPPSTTTNDFDEFEQAPAVKPPTRGPPARLLGAGAKKPSPSSTSTSAPSAPSAAKKPPPSSRPTPTPSAAPTSSSSKPSEPLRFKFTQESAENQVESAEAIPSNLVAMLADSAWKVRLEGIEKLAEWVKVEGRETESEIVVRWLVGKKPGPKESNFQVSGKMFGLFQQLAEDSSTWTKACAAVAIPLCCDKLGDIKLKKPAGDAMISFAEKSSLGFILGQAYESMSKQKAPKTLQESYVFVEQALRDFGIVGGLAVRDLIEFLKVGLKHSNAAVRTQATKTLVTLRLFVGPNITSFLSDLTPQLLSTIESDFEKVSSESAPEPTRIGADTVVSAAPAGPSAAKGKAAGGGTGGNEVDPLDELFPRVDFDRLVPSAMVQACGDANWKVRKEALEAIRDILEANKRIKPTILPDLANPLKARITDSNKIIQLLALDIVARIANGMGKPFGEKLSRNLAPSVAQTLADQKANIRAGGITTLSAMADNGGLEHLVSTFDKPLDANNPLQRKELLGWLEERFKDEDAIAGLELSNLTSSILSCLEDRNAEVRKSATAILPVVISKAGYGQVMDMVSKLKPASRSTVLPIVEAARSSAASSNPPPASRPASTVLPSSSRPPSVAVKAQPPPAPPSASVPPPSAPAPRVPAGLRPTSKPLRSAPSLSQDEVPPAAPSALPPRLAQPRPRASISGLRAVASTSASRTPSSSSAPSPTINREAPFRSSDPNPKVLRHKKETGLMKWSVEGTPRADQVEWLSSQMAPQISASLHALLFSTDHSAERDFVAGLTLMDDCARDPSTAEQFDLDGDEMRDRIVANLDLIIKYITLRIGMTSTTITVKCLDLIDHFMPLLVQSGYKMSDYEASPLLTCLIAKVGDGKETIRQRVRAIFKSICSVYPFSKVFTTILEQGLDNKNTRVRSECVEELGQLYSRHGVRIYPPAQALPLIASFIGKPDATTRTAALHAIGAVYTLVGAEATWKAVGTLPAKDRSMLEERLKRTSTGVASPAPAPRSHTPIDAPGTPGGSLRPPSNRSTIGPGSPSPAMASALGSYQGRTGLPRPGAGIPNRLQRPQSVLASTGNIPQPESHTPRKSVSSMSGLPAPGFGSRITAPTSSRVASNPSSIASSTAFTEDDLMAETVTDLPSLIDALSTDDFSACADVFKLVTREITKNSEHVLLHADTLIDALTNKMELGFTDLSADTSPAQLRLCKHLMQTLSAFFDKRTLSQQVSRMPLTGLLADLTGRLLDTADNTASEPIQSLSKVLNMVLIRIFHHSDQNVCFGALLIVLQDATIDLRELRGSELADRAKYAELVMKCLWKVSKTVKESLETQQLLAPRLLSDINNFLVTIPPAEWRRRSTDNIPLADMPLRTVKTILQQVVSVLKGQVFDELDEIESAENSFVYQYLYRLANQPTGGNGADSAVRAQTLARKQSSSSITSGRSVTSRNSAMSPPLGGPPPRSASSNSNASNGTAPQVSSPGGTDIAVNHRLKEIFDLIGDPNNSRAGISALYEFQKANPEASGRIATWMAGTGSYFQTYLKRALANLEATDRERKIETPTSPSSESMSSGMPSRLSRPSSVASNVAPGTPTRTSSRLSLGPGSSSGTPQQSAKLAELKSMFGVADKE
ncbi:Stu2p [Sporobolomyces salmoneus]|uniref:Stu2p n=1 Tax=Sporobolomyces salmoneus TaxID=183962 RepID=UPI00316B81FF